jgi:hypothetical protein
MRPAFHHDLANARIADLRHHAAQQRTAKAAVRTRRAHTPPHPVRARSHRHRPRPSGAHASHWPPPVASTMNVQRSAGHPGP